MSIYQLKSRDYYIEKSFENKKFRKNILFGMRPGTDIFLIDEHFNTIYVITKSSGLPAVNIYKPIKDDSNNSTNLKARDFYNMTISHEKTARNNLNDFPEVIIRNFLNCYLDSEKESRKIKRIRDRMTFLRYSIEYK